MPSPQEWLEKGEKIIEDQNGNFSRSTRRRINALTGKCDYSGGQQSVMVIDTYPQQAYCFTHDRVHEYPKLPDDDE